MAQSRMQQQHVEQELKKKFEELKNSLADKEEQLSKALRKKNMRSFMHVETLAELSSTEEALKQSGMKCAALEESVQRLQVQDENHKRELREKEESLEKMIEEEQERELLKVRKMFEEELQRKEENMKQQFFQMEKNLQDELKKQKEKYDDKILEKEDWLRQQILEKEASFQKQLAELCQPLEAKAQQWVLKIKDMENQYQESDRMRREQEERTNLELQRLSEELCNLQLQAEKKNKKKGWWRWKFWRKKK